MSNEKHRKYIKGLLPQPHRHKRRIVRQTVHPLINETDLPFYNGFQLLL